MAYSIVTATSVQWYNQRLAYVNILYHSFCMAQANSAKLSIVVRSICCSKIKTVDKDGTITNNVSTEIEDPSDQPLGKCREPSDCSQSGDDR